MKLFGFDLSCLNLGQVDIALHPDSETQCCSQCKTYFTRTMLNLDCDHVVCQICCFYVDPQRKNVQCSVCKCAKNHTQKQFDDEKVMMYKVVCTCGAVLQLKCFKDHLNQNQNCYNHYVIEGTDATENNNRSTISPMQKKDYYHEIQQEVCALLDRRLAEFSDGIFRKLSNIENDQKNIHEVTINTVNTLKLSLYSGMTIPEAREGRAGPRATPHTPDVLNLEHTVEKDDKLKQKSPDLRGRSRCSLPKKMKNGSIDEDTWNGKPNDILPCKQLSGKDKTSFPSISASSRPSVKRENVEKDMEMEAAKPGQKATKAEGIVNSTEKVKILSANLAAEAPKILPEAPKTLAETPIVITQWNCEGFKSRKDIIENDFLCEADVIVLTETFAVNDIHLEGYKSYNCPSVKQRLGRPRGGVSVFVSSRFKDISQVYIGSDTVVLSLSQIFLVATYAGPDKRASQAATYIISKIEKILKGRRKDQIVVLAGDLNCRLDKLNGKTKELIKYLESESIHVVSDASIPTYFSPSHKNPGNSTIDIFACSTDIAQCNFLGYTISSLAMGTKRHLPVSLEVRFGPETADTCNEVNGQLTNDFNDLNINQSPSGSTDGSNADSGSISSTSSVYVAPPLFKIPAWFDEECHETRCKMLNVLHMARNYDEMKLLFIKQRKSYIDLIVAKKAEFMQ